MMIVNSISLYELIFLQPQEEYYTDKLTKISNVNVARKIRTIVFPEIIEKKVA